MNTETFVDSPKAEKRTTGPEKATMAALLIAFSIAFVLFLGDKDTSPLHYLRSQLVGGK